ncbi:MAG: response regulator transcription factor [Desulfofustis sp.]
MKILIAEDEYTTRLMVQVSLEDWGYSVESTKDGNEAWALLKLNNQVEIAILDWEMPGLNGVELCRRIKNMKRSSPIHVILLTARDSRNDISKGFDAGADDYITKPFNNDELRARIKVAERIVTIQSSLNNSLQELKQALNVIDSYQEQILVCPSCSKIESFDGTWRKPAELLAYPVDPRFLLSECPDCKTS